MQVGMDFDNTIVNYDRIFHKVALERGLVEPEVPVSKLAVHDRLRRSGKEDAWTELQGYVYGCRMAEAEPFPHVLGFLDWARRTGVPVAIVSHKTRRPFRGPEYDLQSAARSWIQDVLRDDKGPLVQPVQVFLEETKQAKLARIRAIDCAFFVDDLPEILAAPDFPETTVGILFDPENRHSGAPAMNPLCSWQEIRSYLESQWTPAI